MTDTKQKPDGYAIQYSDGSISANHFYTEDALDYSIQTPYEKQAKDKFLCSKFRQEYHEHYKSDSAIHRAAMEKLEEIYAETKAVKVKLVFLDKGEK